MEYEIKFTIKLRGFIKPIAEFEDRINEFMSQMGHKEKITTSTDIFSMILKVDRELSKEEQDKVSAILKAQIKKNMPQYDIILKSFSCKSKQEVLQSAE